MKRNIMDKDKKIERPEPNRGSMPVPNESINRGNGLESQRSQKEVVEHVTPKEDEKDKKSRDLQKRDELDQLDAE